MPTQIGTFRSSNTLGIKFSPSSWIDGYGPSKSVASFSWPGRSMWMKMERCVISLMHGESMKSWKTAWFEPMSCTVRKIARFSFSFKSPVWRGRKKVSGEATLNDKIGKIKKKSSFNYTLYTMSTRTIRFVLKTKWENIYEKMQVCCAYTVSTRDSLS